MDESKHNPAGKPPDPAASGPDATAHPPAAPSAEEVFRDYAPRVYNLARRMLNSDADAEDVTQDVLLQVVRKLPTFRGESAFPTWLHRVTVNAALAHRRKRATQNEHRSHEPLDMVLEEQPANGPVRRWSVSPEEAALDHETQELIERAIAELPVDYRDVFVLSDVEGLPNAEIGEMLGLSLPAVKSRLHRARQKLRDALAPHFEEVSA
jgi:RNA polymerase sigma-70 factor (ECF subfamily)